jgi:surface antigen
VHNYNGPGISAGAVTAIGLGVGILGFVIGRTTKSKEVIYKDSKIHCKDFDIRVMIDGEEKKAKITKCRTEDGEWKIPE